MQYGFCFRCGMTFTLPHGEEHTCPPLDQRAAMRKASFEWERRLLYGPMPAEPMFTGAFTEEDAAFAVAEAERILRGE